MFNLLLKELEDESLNSCLVSNPITLRAKTKAQQDQNMLIKHQTMDQSNQLHTKCEPSRDGGVSTKEIVTNKGSGGIIRAGPTLEGMQLIKGLIPLS